MGGDDDFKLFSGGAWISHDRSARFQSSAEFRVKRIYIQAVRQSRHLPVTKLDNQPLSRFGLGDIHCEEVTLNALGNLAELIQRRNILRVAASLPVFGEVKEVAIQEKQTVFVA